MLLILVRIEIDLFIFFVFTESKKVTLVTGSMTKCVTGIEGGLFKFLVMQRLED